MDTNDELKSKFSNWCLKAQFNFLETDLFQPIGLEISCADIVLETKEDYCFNGIEKSDIDEKDYPLAYYSPIDDSIHIYIDHYMFQIRQNDFEKQALLAFLLFHEANHRLLMHIKRSEEKDHMLFNIASDMEIHNMFYVYNEIMKADNRYTLKDLYKYTQKHIVNFLFDKNAGEKNLGLFEKDFLQNTAEEIYTILQNSKEVSTQQFQMQIQSENSNSQNGNGSSKEDTKNNKENSSGNTVTVKTTTYKLPSGQKITSTEIEWPTSNENKGDEKDSEKSNNDETAALTRKTLMENTIQKKVGELFDNEEKQFGHGTISSVCKTFLKKLFHIKIDWKKILRNSLLTTLEKSEYFSWAKPRTSLFGLPNAPYLPDQIDDETDYGTVIIARDESGSMSDKECEAAAGIIADSKEYYKKIVVIKHDTEITSVNEINEMNDDAIKMLLKRNSNGGTSHKEVFEFINKYAKKNEEDEKISCCIFITDMCSDIAETQDIIPDSIPRIWLTTSNTPEYYTKNVKGKIIPVEVFN